MRSLKTASELAARVPDGASIVLAPDYSGCSLAVVRELVRRPARGLFLVGVPQLGLQADILIGAGCVASVETAAVSLGELGPRRLSKAVGRGPDRGQGRTCPVIHAGLQAAEKGVPFMPVRGILGTDLVAQPARLGGDRQTHSAPGDDPIVLVPAIRPDVALFHAPRADEGGNVWIGVRRELVSDGACRAHEASSRSSGSRRRHAGDDGAGRRHDPAALCRRHREAPTGAGRSACSAATRPTTSICALCRAGPHGARVSRHISSDGRLADG